MATLPSFVQLMASLGLDNPSSPTSPRPFRSKSIPSLREFRYSPYTQNMESGRRGSLPNALLPESDRDKPVRPYSTSPRASPSPRLYRRRNINANFSVNIYDSTTDLSANTPISSYVRRKTPQSSPISPSFPRDDAFDSPASSPMPFSLPTLPPLFCQSLSATSESFPPTPNSDHPSSRNSPTCQPKPLPEFTEEPFIHRSYRHGVRISTPPRSADFRHHRRRLIA